MNEDNWDGKASAHIQFVILSENGTAKFFASDQELDAELRKLESAANATGKWHVFQASATVHINGGTINWVPLNMIRPRNQ